MNTATLAPTRRALQTLQATWLAREPRERRLVLLAAWLVGLFLLWTVALHPAWRTVRDAPQRLDRLDAQLQVMQTLAADASDLRSLTPLSRTQAGVALRAASERLGSRARLTEQGERAVLSLDGVPADELRSWLAEVRASARARAVDVNLTLGEQGVSGTVVVALPGA